MTDRKLGDVTAARRPSMSDTLTDIVSGLANTPDSATILRRIVTAAADLLGADATGVMLTDPRGGLEVAAASDGRARVVELLQTQLGQGPCVDCVATGTVVVAADLSAERERWPGFVPTALALGYRAVLAVPLVLDGRPVGGLNLLYTGPLTVGDGELRTARLLADLAVLGLVQERGDRRIDRLAEMTMTAFNDRAIIDQAVGLVAGTHDLDAATARHVLLDHADRNGSSPQDLARAITDGTFDLTVLVDSR